jgi:SMI1/KNR4 family protein SUKH-1
MDIRNGYWIGGPAELTRSMRRHDYPTRFDAHGQPAHAIPIATDGGGNAFMISVDVGSVWRWDHGTGAVACISSDLAEFLRRVAEDWVHDLDGDDTWNYLV